MAELAPLRMSKSVLPVCYDSTNLRGFIPGFRFVALSLALAAAVWAQPIVRGVLSNKEARKAATYTQEATIPAGFNATELTVRVSVKADGTVQNVSNSHSLPDPLFAAAADAARQWRFRTDRDKGKPHGFDAEISFHGPLVGTVVSTDEKPVAGVVVFGSEWFCCPPQQDKMTTDQSGSFRIEHPGAVLHFLPSDGFQPQALVVAPEMSTVKVTLAPISNSFSLAACSQPQRGFERIGWGKYGLQFDVPDRDVRLTRGKVDVDYVVHIVNARRSDNRVEFWFGPYAMTSTPEDERFVESETFATRNIIMPKGLVRGSAGGVIGSDTWGHLPNGTMWRQTAFGLEGARYSDVSPDNAAIFDKIINSACWIPSPEQRLPK